jgi:hypothetical protein
VHHLPLIHRLKLLHRLEDIGSSYYDQEMDLSGIMISLQSMGADVLSCCRLAMQVEF